MLPQVPRQSGDDLGVYWPEIKYLTHFEDILFSQLIYRERKPPSLISVFVVHSKGSYGPKVFSCEHSDQTGWMPRLILSLRWAHR